jgi:murein hydrolase activator
LIKPRNIGVIIQQKATSGILPVLVILNMVMTLPAFGQLQLAVFKSEQRQLEREIEFTKSLIDRTRDMRQATLSDLTLIQASINSRQRLIAGYQAQQQYLYDTIFSTILFIDKMREEIEMLKDEYAKMILAANRIGNTNQHLIFMLASESFHQAFNRLNHIRAYAEERRDHAAKIAHAEDVFANELIALEGKMEVNELLIRKLSAGHQLLHEELELKRKTLAELTGQEKHLAMKYNRLHKDHENLKKRIELVISEDQEIAYESIGINQEDQYLTARFENSWGKMPWPSEFGIVTSQFGEQEHPDLKSLKIRNNGINILTNEGSPAYAVFDGVVTRVMHVSNFNQVVILRHGVFLTVYSNLENVQVNRGDRVQTAQQLGTIHTDPDSAKTELHFELWKGKVQLNPLQWLSATQDAAHVNTGDTFRKTFD